MRILRAVLVASALIGLVPVAPGQQPASEGWRPFRATWTLSGQRQTLDTGGERPAAVVHLTGTITLTSGGEELRHGFFSEFIGLDDGGSVLVGRIVLVDDRTDRIYCAVKAEPLGNGRHATATITGGTGRFARLEGEFTFSWQYVVDARAGEINLRAVNVAGRTRRTAAPGGSASSR